MDGIALRMVSGARTLVGDLPDMDVRCLNVFHLLGLKTAGEVAVYGRQKLWRARSMGRKSLARIERALAAVGLDLVP
jgi:DNA-directed RNA polymerase alpha subunit